MDKIQMSDTNTDALEQTEQTQAETAENPFDDVEDEVMYDSPDMPETEPAPSKEGHNDRSLGVGEWMITILFFLLPGINLIMMFLWAFSSRGNVHRRNLSRACLLWAIVLLIGFIVAITVAGYSLRDILRMIYRAFF